MSISICFKDVIICRGNRELVRIPELTMHDGSIIALIGENGSGKTTLLRTLAGLDHGFRGEIRVRGLPLREFFRKGSQPRQLMMVGAEPFLFCGSVEANLEFGLRRTGLPKKDRNQKICEIMAELRVDHLAGRQANRLSSGETKRVAVARALVLEPEVLLLDEPFAGVDPASAQLLERTLKQRLKKHRQQLVVFTAHHDIQAFRITDQTLKIFDGVLGRNSLDAS
jgi:tungstate transport system ATP-binding protein